jgi:hypothetical protein
VDLIVTSQHISPHPSDYYDIKPQLSCSDTHLESYSVHRSKLKASDLLEYNGRDSGDIDQWIGKITAIFEFSNCQVSELLQRLPMVLQDKALTCFTQLTRQREKEHSSHLGPMAVSTEGCILSA